MSTEKTTTNKQFKFIVIGVVDYIENETKAKQYLDKKLRGSSIKSIDSIEVSEVKE